MEEEGSIPLRSPSTMVGWLKSVCGLVLTLAFSFIINTPCVATGRFEQLYLNTQTQSVC